MILSGSKAGLVNEPLYRYRVMPGALSARRADLTRGTIAVLDRAARRPDLSAGERQVVSSSRARRRRELAGLDLDDSLRTGAGVRRRAVDVLRVRGASPRVRLRAAVALAAPRLLPGSVPDNGWEATGPSTGSDSVGTRPPVRVVAYTDAEQVGGAEISLGHVLTGLEPGFEVVVMGVDAAVVAYLVELRQGAKAASCRRSDANGTGAASSRTFERCGA